MTPPKNPDLSIPSSAECKLHVSTASRRFKWLIHPPYHVTADVTWRRMARRHQCSKRCARRPCSKDCARPHARIDALDSCARKFKLEIALFHHACQSARGDIFNDDYLNAWPTVQANRIARRPRIGFVPRSTLAKRETYTRAIRKSPTATVCERQSRPKRLGANVGRSIVQLRSCSCFAPPTNPSRSESIHPDDQEPSNGISLSAPTNFASDDRHRKND